MGLTGTYRHRTKLLFSPYIGASAADYQDIVATHMPGYDINGNVVGFTGNIYGSALPASFTGGEFITNRPDYAQNYYGLTLQATKRLSNNWMMHGSFAYNDWKQDIKNPATACVDPTNQRLMQDLFYNNGNPLPFSTGPELLERTGLQPVARKRRVHERLHQLALELQRQRSLSAAAELRPRRQTSSDVRDT